MNIFRKRSTLKKIDPNINGASQMDKAHPERLGSFLNPNSSYVNVPQAPSLSPQGNNPTPHLLSFLIKHDYFGVSAPKSNPISKTAVNICDKSIEKIQKKSMKENKKIANDGFDSILILENRDELKFRSKSLVSVVTNNGKEYFDHWTANYCANGQDIEGILVINAGIMTFTATRNTEAPIKIGKKPPKPSKIEKTLGNFEAIINIQDIIGCKIMTFPIPCAKHCHKSDNIHILQLTLCEHGEYSLGENIEETLIEMREKRTPYACVYFNIKPECGNNSNDKESIRALIHIQTKIKAAMDSLNRDKGDFWQKTNLPYFEFLPMNFQPNMADTLRLGRQLIKKNIDAQLARLRGQDQTLGSKVIGGDLLDQAANIPVTKKPKKLIIPNTLDESGIISSRQLGQIISCMPDLYQMFEWKLLYATVQHGTSFNNLMRRANLANPFVIIARDFNDNIFGAYGSASLKFSQNYYGTAETFLFTFKKGQEIQDFQWSKKNDMYIFTNDEGIMFGTGPFYGLWIGSDLTRGRTYSCDTFDNDQLTDSTDFEITRLEVWSIVDPFNKR